MSDNKVVPFNPLDKRHLGESVGQAMLRQPVVPLENLAPFNGVGIYAIYYVGDFSAYGVIAECNKGDQFRAPIYVGKAVPGGARKGGDLQASPKRELHKRLTEHRDSLEQAANLDLRDFHCRYLLVDDIWIPLGESLLIAKFNPVWNKLVDGFGNHNPGAGRHKGLRPRWDVLHPGRPWAERLQSRLETADHIAAEVRNYLSANPPPENDEMITT